MLGERIYFFRKQMGLSQKELAALLNVTNKAISKWETGAALPKTETIIKLAEIFNVSSDELLNIANKSKEQKTPEPSTLEELCEHTNNYLQKEMLVVSKPKLQYEFTVGTSKLYLITTILVFLFCIAGLTFFAFSFWDIMGNIFTWYIWVVLEFFAAFVLMGLYTGMFCFIKYFRRFSVAVQVISILLFSFTLIVIFYGGVILLIPTIIKAIKVLINSKRECENEK